MTDTPYSYTSSAEHFKKAATRDLRQGITATAMAGLNAFTMSVQLAAALKTEHLLFLLPAAIFGAITFLNIQTARQSYASALENTIDAIRAPQ